MEGCSRLARTAVTLAKGCALQFWLRPSCGFRFDGGAWYCISTGRLPAAKEYVLRDIAANVSGGLCFWQVVSMFRDMPWINALEKGSRSILRIYVPRGPMV